MPAEQVDNEAMEAVAPTMATTAIEVAADMTVGHRMTTPPEEQEHHRRTRRRQQTTNWNRWTGGMR